MNTPPSSTTKKERNGWEEQNRRRSVLCTVLYTSSTAGGRWKKEKRRRFKVKIKDRSSVRPVLSFFFSLFSLFFSSFAPARPKRRRRSETKPVPKRSEEDKELPRGRRVKGEIYMFPESLNVFLGPWQTCWQEAFLHFL